MAVTKRKLTARDITTHAQSIDHRHTTRDNRMLMINATVSDWLRRLHSQPMDMPVLPAFIEDVAENVISIIYFEETAASKKSTEMYL